MNMNLKLKRSLIIMTTNFTEQELNAITQDPENINQEQEIQAEPQESAPSAETALTTVSSSMTMTIDQSIYAIVEPGTAPLLRSSTTTDNAKLFNALNGNAEPVKDWIGEEIDVCDIVITSTDVPSIMGDDSSERVCKPCVHFFCLDGTHISSISNGIIRATKMLLACGLTPTEESPITICFKEIQTKNGRAHTFDMV
jgi:hypothetical protein